MGACDKKLMNVGHESGRELPLLSGLLTGQNNRTILNKTFPSGIS